MRCGFSVAIVCLALLQAHWAASALAQDAPPAAPPAAETPGIITGTVIDKSTGDPIIEAGVEVLGLKKKTRTDIDGKYSIKVPPGTYDVRFFAPLYQGARIEKVVVKANETTKVSTPLSAAVAGVEVVEVVAKAKKASEQTQILKRQKAETIQDNIGAETIAKTPDSDAGEIVQRLTGVTISEDKFLYVRGLGERYSSALLNGSRIGSPDPEKRVVPLDLFPSNFIEAMSVTKSYSPNLPGDFSGGLLDIDLRDFPEKLEAGFSVSTAANTSTTGRRFLTYRGLGRSLPSVFPDSNIQIPTVPLQRLYAGSLPNVWSPQTQTAPPDGNVTVTAGNSWGKFGLSLAGVYDNSYQTLSDWIVRTIVNTGGETPEPGVSDNFRYDQGTHRQSLSGLLTTSYLFNDDHRANFRALVNSLENNQTLAGRGTAQGANAAETTRLQRTTSELDFGQFSGSDHFRWLDVDWRSAFSRTLQDIPDSRTISYQGNDFNQLAYTNDGSGGQRAFSTMDEYFTSSALDFTVPFKTRLPFTDVWSGLNAKLRFGAAYDYRDRDYALRLFRYRRTGGSSDLAFQPPEVLLGLYNIGSVITFQEETRQRDKFHATQEIGAGYGMLDLPIVRDRFRFSGGVRLQSSYIRLNTATDADEPVVVRKNDLNPLPAVSLTYTPRSDMNIRGSWSKTVTYPEFRELTPALFPQPRGFRPIVGNPDLVQTNITSADLRWEWFFAPNELVSAGVFWKSLDQPIEPVLLAFSSFIATTFDNAESAKLRGFEFEGRKNFGFVTSRMQNLSLGLNVTYQYSKSTLGAAQTAITTSSSRELVGAPPFIINAVLEWEQPDWFTARLLYNTAARSISEAGAYFLPDIFKERRDQLDAVLIFPLQATLGLPLTVKASVENILNDQYLVTQGGLVQEQSLKGTRFGLGISYAY